MITKIVVAVMILANLVGACWRSFHGDQQGAILFMAIATFLRVGQNTPPAPRA